MPMKIAVVKAEKRRRFERVEIREPLMQDVILAERVTGKTEGVEFQLALLSQVGTFDGQRLPPEELKGVSMQDFLAISTELLGSDMRALLAALLGQQSPSPGKQDQDSEKSPA
jgi:hypothetical protein